MKRNKISRGKFRKSKYTTANIKGGMDKDNAAAIEINKTVSDSASRYRNLCIFFDGVCLFFLFAALSTPEEAFLDLEASGINIPFAGIEVPYIFFYTLGPVLLLILQINLYINLYAHNKKMDIAPEDDSIKDFAMLLEGDGIKDRPMLLKILDANKKMIRLLALNFTESIAFDDIVTKYLFTIITHCQLFILPILTFICLLVRIIDYQDASLIAFNISIFLIALMVMLFFIAATKSKLISFMYFFIYALYVSYIYFFITLVSNDDLVSDDCLEPSILYSIPGTKLMTPGKIIIPYFKEYQSGYKYTNYDGRSFVCADFSYVNFNNQTFERADFTRASLVSTQFSGANLQEANLQEADLQGANLRGANLEGANLYGVDLQGANLQGANLQGANLRGANLRGANLQGAILVEADLQEVDLQEIILRGADITMANLQFTNLEGANLQGSDLTGANLQGAYIHAANLQGSSLHKANLRGAVLLNSNLYGAYMLNTNFNGVVFDDISTIGHIEDAEDRVELIQDISNAIGDNIRREEVIQRIENAWNETDNKIEPKSLILVEKYSIIHEGFTGELRLKYDSDIDYKKLYSDLAIDILNNFDIYERYALDKLSMQYAMLEEIEKYQRIGNSIGINLENIRNEIRR